MPVLQCSFNHFGFCLSNLYLVSVVHCNVRQRFASSLATQVAYVRERHHDTPKARRRANITVAIWHTRQQGHLVILEGLRRIFIPLVCWSALCAGGRRELATACSSEGAKDSQLQAAIDQVHRLPTSARCWPPCVSHPSPYGTTSGLSNKASMRSAVLLQ